MCLLRIKKKKKKTSTAQNHVRHYIREFLIFHVIHVCGGDL